MAEMSFAGLSNGLVTKRETGILAGNIIVYQWLMW